MGFREVKPEDVKEDSGKFLKMSTLFPEVGSKFTGVYVSDEPGNYEKQNYTFEVDGEAKVLSASKQLHKTLLLAKLEPGEKVLITCTEKVDIGKDHPMSKFGVKVSDQKVPLKSQPVASEDPF